MDRFWHSLWAVFRINIGTKLVSVVIAIVLWVVVLGSRQVEVTKEVPLEVITPSDLVPGNEIPEKVAFRLAGPKAFLRAILDRREEPIRINLAGAKPGLVTYRFFSDNIRLPIGVKVLSINPTAILIKLEYLKRREVPVRASLHGAAPDGYRIVKAELRPPMVRIKGSESNVDAVTEISTLPVDVSGMRQTVDREVSLDLARNKVQLDSEPPKLHVEIEPLAANFRIRNVDVRVLSSHHVRLDEKNVTVLVRAGAEHLKSLDRRNVFAVIDLSGKPSGTYLEPVKVTLPDDVVLVKVVPDKIKVTLY